MKFRSVNTAELPVSWLVRSIYVLSSDPSLTVLPATLSSQPHCVLPALLCPPSRTVLPATLSSHPHCVLPATLCPPSHTVLPATLSSQPHCPPSHTVSSQPHCPPSHTVLPAALSSQPHCPPSRTVLPAALSSSHTVLPATLSSQPHCPSNLQYLLQFLLSGFSQVTQNSRVTRQGGTTPFNVFDTALLHACTELVMLC